MRSIKPRLARDVGLKMVHGLRTIGSVLPDGTGIMRTILINVPVRSVAAGHFGLRMEDQLTVLEHYYKELLSFLSRAIDDRDRAADVVQETYFRVLTLEARKTEGEAPRLGMIREPRALLYRTAKNIVVDQHRRALVRRHDQFDGQDETEAAAPSASQPEAIAESRQLARRLLNTIESLPARCREAFVLYKIDGLPQAEIATRMGISRNMVEKHVIAGMLACRRCLPADDEINDRSD